MGGVLWCRDARKQSAARVGESAHVGKAVRHWGGQTCDLRGVPGATGALHGAQQRFVRRHPRCRHSRGHGRPQEGAGHDARELVVVVRLPRRGWEEDGLMGRRQLE